MKDKKLTKSNHNKMFFGVCTGFAAYFNMDPTIIRLIFVVLAMIKGIGILLYLVAALVMPSDSSLEDTDIENGIEEKKLKEDESKDSQFRTDEEFDSYFKKTSNE